MLAALGSEIVFPSLAPIYIEASCPSELPPYEPNVSSSNRFQNHIPSPDRRRDFFWNCFYAPAFIHSAAEKKKTLSVWFYKRTWVELEFLAGEGLDQRSGKEGRACLVGIHKTNCRGVWKMGQWQYSSFEHSLNIESSFLRFSSPPPAALGVITEALKILHTRSRVSRVDTV